MNGLTGNADALTGNADTLTGNVNALTGNADALTGNADGKTGNADALTGNADGITENADALTGNADALTGNADALTGNGKLFKFILLKINFIVLHERDARASVGEFVAKLLKVGRLFAAETLRSGRSRQSGIVKIYISTLRKVS